MSRKFKAKNGKKQNKWKILKFVLFIILIYCMYQFVVSLFLNVRLASSNEEFVSSLLKDSNHHMLYQKRNQNFADQLIQWVSNINIQKPVSILEQVFGYELDTNTASDEVLSVNEEEDELENPTEYFKDPNPTVIENPRVYIYNTHQLENYSATNFEEYNITPNVLMASYLLKEKLNKLNIPTVVETSNITDFLALNNWDYSHSYQASKFFITDALNQYSNLDLLIDLHRDSINKASSTTEIEGKKYAKVLFVVGLEHENYQANLDLANTLSNKIKELYPTLSRGVLTKEGKGVNGIYNQDLSPKSVLIECGGKENTIEEVMNTIEALSVVIQNYLG